MPKPAAFTSVFPPTQHTFRGAITMRLASGGADADELISEFTELAADCEGNFPDDAPVAPDAVPAVVAEVIDAYNEVVTTLSPDAEGLMASLDDLFEAGILYSYGEAFEASDAMEMIEDALGQIEEAGGQLRGYLYSLVTDLDELVLNQRLEVNYGVFDADADAVPALAQNAVAILRSHGLEASWSGDLSDPIIIEPIVVNAPLVSEDDHQGHDH